MAVPPRQAFQPPRFYAVTRVDAGYEKLLGVHHTVWADLERQLPLGRLHGSGCHLRGFNSRPEAEQYWRDAGGYDPVPFHEAVANDGGAGSQRWDF